MKSLISTNKGFALISSLFILLVVTLIAVAMGKNYNVQEKISGNVREKARALNAALAAEQYAEWTLSKASYSINTGSPCSGLVNYVSGTSQVCSNPPPSDVTAIPWGTGVNYQPPNMTLSTTGGDNAYYANPLFYIYYLGAAPGGQGAMYQVDALGYGGTQNAVAVVESIFLVSSGVKDLGAL
ncbi:MAG TPA: PilX N-terminal domain-containing pilus assembly protein [Pseudomonadales bacterium]|nr:PilX N-terminal domain-containing pilus assembly protein [Pseudomonadales bacterium]